jgi:hypothetical protein
MQSNGFGTKGQKTLTPAQAKRKHDADLKAWLKSPTARLGDDPMNCLMWWSGNDQQRRFMDAHASIVLRMAGLS